MKPGFWMSAIGLAFLAAVGHHFIYLPQQAEVASIHAQITQEYATQQTQADVAKLLEQVEPYRSRLPSEPDPSWVVQEAATLAHRTGVELTTITQEAPQPFGRLTRIAVTLQLLASYHQLGAFLDELERSDHFIRVERLEMNPTTEQGGQVPVDVVLSTVSLPPTHGLSGGQG